MFDGRIPPSPNAIDMGDTIPITPSCRPNTDRIHKHANRVLKKADQPSTRRGRSPRHQHIEDFDLTPPASSPISNAQDGADEENNLGKHKNAKFQNFSKPSKKYFSQFLFGSDGLLQIASRNDLSIERSERSPSSSTLGTKSQENEGQRRHTLFCLLFLLTFFIAFVIAIIATARALKTPMSLTPENPSTTDPTSSPSITNKRTFNSIVAFLHTFTTVDDQHFQDTTKPQHQAISWMADIDTFAYSIPGSTTDDGYFDFVQRYALAVLYYATNGEKWDNSSYFLKPTHACNWNYEIPFIENETMKVGVTCDKKKEVTALIMRTYTTA